MAKKQQLTVILGSKVKELRIAKGYSQEDFAAAANLDRAGYGRIERGEVDLRLSTIERLAKALRIPIANLFDSN